MAVLSTDYQIVIFRSRLFSLNKVDERVEALRAVIAQRHNEAGTWRARVLDTDNY